MSTLSTESGDPASKSPLNMLNLPVGGPIGGVTEEEGDRVEVEEGILLCQLYIRIIRA